MFFFLVFPQRYAPHRCDENGVWRKVFLLPCFCEMDTWNSFPCFFVCVLGTTTWNEEIRCCISIPPNPRCFCLRNRSHSAWHIFVIFDSSLLHPNFAEQKIVSCSIMGNNYMLTHLFLGDSIGRHHPWCFQGTFTNPNVLGCPLRAQWLEKRGFRRFMGGKDGCGWDIQTMEDFSCRWFRFTPPRIRLPQTHSNNNTFNSHWFMWN